MIRVELIEKWLADRGKKLTSEDKQHSRVFLPSDNGHCVSGLLQAHHDSSGIVPAAPASQSSRIRVLEFQQGLLPMLHNRRVL